MTRLAKNPNSWLHRDPSLRRTMINDLYIHREDMDGMIAKMDKLRQGHREKKEATCLTIIGDPGVGKTQLLQHYTAERPIVTTSDSWGIRRKRPVLYLELESACTVRMVCEDALRVMMGDEAPRGESARSMFQTQLKVQGVELVILDEFQHVGEMGREKTRSKTADFVKSVTKRSKIPMVLSGMAAIRGFVDEIWQLETISPYHYIIPPYDPATGLDAFIDHLNAVDEKLPFDQRSLLGEPKRAASLLVASQGYLRYLARILSEAGAIAIDEEACCIFDEHLLAACEEEGVHPNCPLPPSALFGNPG